MTKLHLSHNKLYFLNIKSIELHHNGEKESCQIIWFSKREIPANAFFFLRLSKSFYSPYELWPQLYSRNQCHQWKYRDMNESSKVSLLRVVIYPVWSKVLPLITNVDSYLYCSVSIGRGARALFWREHKTYAQILWKRERERREKEDIFLSLSNRKLSELGRD